jgi:hypothetical protein
MEEEEGFGAKGETGHLVRARRTSQGGARSWGRTQEGALLGVRASRTGTRKPHSGLEGPSCRRTLLKFSSHVTSCWARFGLQDGVDCWDARKKKKKKGRLGRSGDGILAVLGRGPRQVVSASLLRDR